jgi:hypothetical protein
MFFSPRNRYRAGAPVSLIVIENRAKFESPISRSSVSSSSVFVGGRANQWMERTRVAPVKGSKCARKSLAHFELFQHRPRAVHLGRYT